MTDERLRHLERLASQGDLDASRALGAELCRVGQHEPCASLHLSEETSVGFLRLGASELWFDRLSPEVTADEINEDSDANAAGIRATADFDGEYLVRLQGPCLRCGCRLDLESVRGFTFE